MMAIFQNNTVRKLTNDDSWRQLKTTNDRILDAQRFDQEERQKWCTKMNVATFNKEFDDTIQFISYETVHKVMGKVEQTRPKVSKNGASCLYLIFHHISTVGSYLINILI